MKDWKDQLTLYFKKSVHQNEFNLKLLADKIPMDMGGFSYPFFKEDLFDKVNFRNFINNE